MIRTRCLGASKGRSDSLLVAGGVGDKVKDIGERLVRVAATETAETPVGLDSGQGRAVGVVGRVGLAREVLRQSTAEQD